jgi:carbamoyltransferase
MKFLGIRNGHDANLTYSDGPTVRYVKFERNFQQKHYFWNPNNPQKIDYAHLLTEAQRILGVSFDDLDAICLSNDNAHHTLPRAMQLHELVMDVKSDTFFSQFNCPVFNLDHHYTHALSTWMLTDLTQVRTHFVLDGLGDHGRVSGIFRDGQLVEYVDRTENLGLSVTMERIGEQYGMHGMVLDMSGKLMALKSYHTVPASLVEQVKVLTAPLQYRHLNQFMNVIEQVQNQTNIHKGDEKQKLINLAYFLHVFGEEKMADYFARYADPSEVVTYSGGTAQNTVVNTSLRNRFPHLQIPPHCPDDGLSFGCVEFLRQHFQQEPFDTSGFPYWQSDIAPTSTPSAQTIEKTAELLAQGKIVGWYQGQGEVGPRALGNRSILMDPTLAGGKDLINAKVKHREPYRPFGASVLLEHTHKIFYCDYESPYMLYVIDCRDRERYASIVHVDGSCRIQTVNEDPQYAVYRDVIEAFRRKTGVPMLLNTSLNVDGKPIAGSPDDALTLLKSSEMDAVVIGDEMYVK